MCGFGKPIPVSYGQYFIREGEYLPRNTPSSFSVALKL